MRRKVREVCLPMNVGLPSSLDGTDAVLAPFKIALQETFSLVDALV